MTATSTPHRPTALVTGAAVRLGRAVALALASRGHPLAIHYRGSQAEAEATAAAALAAGAPAAAIIHADLAQEDQTAALIDQATAALGPVGVLVNNASIFERDEALTATRTSWDRHMEINLRAPFVLLQRFAQALPNDWPGVAINLLDQRVFALTPHFTSYSVSKAGLWALTQTMALALAPRIRVMGVGPGPTLPSVHQTPAGFARQCAAMPLGRGATPEEIARACVFILETDSLTGQMIALDGGQHLAWCLPGASPEAMA